jgi:group I intron endonuclease
MKIIYGIHRDSGGIYKIVNVENGRVYVGSTTHFRKRFMSHQNALESNRHQNRFLQNDWNKCGADKFIIEVVEVIKEKEQIIIREQFFIDQHYDNQKNCYNIRKDAADSRVGSKNILVTDPLTDKRCKSPSETLKAKRGKGVKQFYESDPANREKKAEKTRELWQAKSPTIGLSLINLETKERVVLDKPLRAWADERGLSYKALHMLVKGKVKTSSGWYLEGSDPAPKCRKGEKRKPMSEEMKNKKSRDALIKSGLIGPNDSVPEDVMNYFSKNVSCESKTTRSRLRKMAIAGKVFITKNGWYNKPEALDKIKGVCNKCQVVMCSASGFNAHQRMHLKIDKNFEEYCRPVK